MQKIMGTYDKGFSGISKKAREYVLSNNAHNITHLCCYYLKKKPAHDTEKELALINDNQRKFVCEYFKESYEVLGIKVEKAGDE